MMDGLQHNKPEIPVMVVEREFFSRQAICRLLAIDLGTRVVAQAESIPEALRLLEDGNFDSPPTVVVLDTRCVAAVTELETAIAALQDRLADVAVLCLAPSADPLLIEAAALARAAGLILRDEIRLLIAGVIAHAMEGRFVVTKSVLELLAAQFKPMHYDAERLAAQLRFDFTPRVEQVVRMYIVDGMPAALIADELKLSTHTVRSYIKIGYEEMGVGDQIDAFHRLTALVPVHDNDLPSGRHDTILFSINRDYLTHVEA